MKSTIQELKNFTSKMVSKKSILILPSIVLLFLVNACTPLPTGGPVSANRVYKVHNKKVKMFADQNTNWPYDSTGIDVNNDNIPDFYIVIDGYDIYELFLLPNNNTELAINTNSNPTLFDQFNLSEPINDSNNWDFNRRYIMTSDITGMYIQTIITTNNGAGACILGLRINDGTNYNYAWVKLDFNILTKEVTVIESAYNTLANQPILAGKK